MLGDSKARILKACLEEPARWVELMRATGLSPKTLHQHLKSMLEAGLLLKVGRRYLATWRGRVELEKLRLARLIASSELTLINLSRGVAVYILSNPRLKADPRTLAERAAKLLKEAGGDNLLIALIQLRNR